MKKLFLSLLVGCLLSGCGGGSGDGGGFVSNPNTGPNLVPPVVVNDTYTSLGNASVAFSAAQGLLSNDTANGGTVTAGNFNTAQGGVVTVSTDGSFRYSPARAFRGSDTFSYEVTNAQGNATGTATINLPKLCWFVDNSKTNGNGTLDNPYNTFSQANQSTSAQTTPTADDGDVIFVFRGDGTTTGLINAGGTLKNGVSVVGEVLGLSRDGVIVAPGGRPLTGLQLRPGDNNIIAGLEFTNAGANNHAIFTDQDENLTLLNNVFNADTTTSVLVVDIKGQVKLENNVFKATNGGAIGVQARNGPNVAGEVVTYDISGNTFAAEGSLGAGGSALDFTIARGYSVTANLSGNTLSASNGGAWSEYLKFRKDAAGAIQGAEANFTLVSETITGTSANSLDLENSSNGVLQLSVGQSTITNSRRQGLRWSASDTSNNKLIVSTSTFSSAQAPATFSTTNAALGAVRLQGSTFTVTAFVPSLLAVPLRTTLESNSTADFCLDASGNTFNQGLEMNQNGTGPFRVEEFGTLSNINNGAALTTSGTFTTIADGVCIF